jgi:hypothetical protein
MPARNTDKERAGTRYGRRVVLSSDAIICGQIKYIGLWVRCDCGRVDLVRKSMLVSGYADRCVECKADERSAVMIDQWAQRKRGMNRENRV